jgi:hypothetical protein
MVRVTQRKSRKPQVLPGSGDLTTGPFKFHARAAGSLML